MASSQSLEDLMLAADIKIKKKNLMTNNWTVCKIETTDMNPTHKNIPKLGENMCVIPSEANGKKRAQ